MDLMSRLPREEADLMSPCWLFLDKGGNGERLVPFKLDTAEDILLWKLAVGMVTI